MRRISGLKRLSFGITALAIVFLAGVVGYRLAGWTWVESFYMVVLILSTVGLETVHPLGRGMMVFTTLVTMFGVFTVLFIMGVFVQMTTEGELNRALGLRRVGREIKRLSQHIVVCGFGRMGEILAAQLRAHGRDLVIIDKDPDRIAEADRLGYLTINDDATEEDCLVQAGVREASVVMTTLPSDADNVFIALTSRDLNSKLQIIARGELPTTEKKLQQAGANRVVLPSAAGALRMAAMITRPSMLELVELVAGRHSAEAEVDQLVLAGGSPLVGHTIGESHVRSRHGVLIVALRRTDDRLIFAPGADVEFQVGDTVIVMGQSKNLEWFRKEYGL